MSNEKELKGSRRLVKDLCSLARLDFEAIVAYQHVIEVTDDTSLRSKFERFRDHHEKHLANLTSVILGLDGTPPSLDRTTRKFDGETVSQNHEDNENSSILDVVRKLRTNEAHSSRKYADALSLDLYEDLRELIESHREEERGHMAFLDALVQKFETEERRDLNARREPPAAYT